MRKLISFMHVSLDGFVAGPKGELNWARVDEELFAYVGRRINEGDTALYGRVTYGMMESYWPAAGTKPGATPHDIEHSRWYNSVRKIVLSKKMHNEGLSNTLVIGDDIPERIHEIKQQAGPDILVFGSPSATRTLMQLGLIDGYWLFLNPIVLGEGIPLFAGIQERINLTLLPPSRSFASGVTELNYVVNK